MLLLDATPLQSEHRLRGIGAYLRQLIGALEKAPESDLRYLVSTIGKEHLAALPQERLVYTRRRHQPAQVYWCYSELAFRLPLWRYRPDVFLATDFNGLVTNPFGKTIAVHYDLTAFKLGAANAPTLSRRLSDLRWRAYAHKLKRADGVLTISHSAKADAVSLLGIPAERIHVVHLGVDHERFYPATRQGRFASAPPYFVHLGACNSNKNQARVLQAFARVAGAYRDVQLYFAGPWQGTDLDWLSAEVQALGLAGRVRHLGYMADTDLPSLYGNALAFVFPSLEEGFGLPVLEAMACGAPVITSNCSSLPEVAGKAALLVDPYSVNAIAHALRCVLGTPDLGVRLRCYGVAQAARFTWAATAQATRDYLERD